MTVQGQTAAMPAIAEANPRPLLSGRATALVWGLGTALFIASLVYLGLGIRRNWAALADLRIEHVSWLAGSIAVYAVSHFSTGAAWPLTLRALGEPVKMADGLKIGFVAQVGKYLPGNVAHYFGRAALAKARGVTIRSSGLSTIIELGCAAVAASVVGLGVFASGRAHVPMLPALGFPLAAGTVAAGLAVLAVGCWSMLGPRRLLLLAAACGSITLSLALSGTSAYALLQAMGAAAPWPLVAGSFGLAWIIGFVIPGAPAGFGVREVIFVTLLSPAVGSEVALACAILHRLVTAGVDLAVALWGYFWFGAAARSNT